MVDVVHGTRQDDAQLFEVREHVLSNINASIGLPPVNPLNDGRFLFQPFNYHAYTTLFYETLPTEDGLKNEATESFRKQLITV